MKRLIRAVLVLSPLLGTLLFLLQGGSACNYLIGKVMYPPGWRELAFDGRVVSLEGSVPNHSKPGYAVVELKEGGQLRMRRRLGMTESPEVGELVRKSAGSMEFEVAVPPRPGEPPEVYWQSMRLFDGVEGIRVLWIYPAVWFAYMFGVGFLLGVPLIVLDKRLSRRRRR